MGQWKNFKKKVKLYCEEYGFDFERDIFRQCWEMGMTPIEACKSLKGNHPLAHTEPAFPVFLYGEPLAPYAKEENPMRAYDTVTTNATTITFAPAASANIETKTDLQTQRDFLLKRHREVESSIDYGTLFRKMREAFNIDFDNTPKTARDLIDGIKSGKYTLDEKVQAAQDIEIADGDDWAAPLRAMNWGGLQPDHVGFAAAQSKFYADLKAAKDTIMIGTPEAGLAAIQALEAWTPPATAAAN